MPAPKGKTPRELGFLQICGDFGQPAADDAADFALKPAASRRSRRAGAHLW